MNSDIESKLESNNVHNIQKSSKVIKCFCNDDQQCPDDGQPQDTLQNILTDSEQSVQVFLNQTKNKLRYCETNTVCLTKKVEKRSGEFWMKYSCDHTAINSIRGQVIEFRDCKINTKNAHDKYIVSRKAEFCCDERNFCNIELVPKESVKELLIDYANLNNHLDNTLNTFQNPHEQHTTVKDFLNPINLVLSCFSIGVILIAIVLFAFYLYKKFKYEPAKLKQFKSQIYKQDPITPPSGLNSNTCDSPLSPYSSSTTSTTNTSIHSKENSSYPTAPILVNSSNNSSIVDYANFNSHFTNNIHKTQMYSNEIKLKSPELFNELKPLFSTSANDDAIIAINSPLSTTTQSSSAAYINNSIETPQSPSELEWSGSGSGAGFPQCVQRTIARQIKLIYPCIGKGRFGEVYKGEWRGEYVAVKTFNSADEKSWENECNIYNTSGFRHENILGFIAADNIDRGLYTELWLITEFHQNGSLYDYLTLNQINPSLALKMALSIVNGLVHLHMPIESCKGKPALAHCDLKSKNILVKSDLSCCIGDLGLALSGDKDGKVSQSGSIRTGTKRYMSPEILSKRIDYRNLDAFQKAEMYSLALIFWELLRTCKFQDDQTKEYFSFEYKMPYFEYIQNSDPDEALMIKIVCEQKLRPGLNTLWKKNALMFELMRLTEELWVENPNERLNALRLKKSLTKIKTNLVDRIALPTILN